MAYSAAALPVVVTSILFTSIAFITMCLRIWTRVFMLKSAGPDDYLMLVAMLASIGFCVVVFMRKSKYIKKGGIPLTCSELHYGLGRPFLSIPVEDIPKFLQCLWATIPVYNLALTFSKLSIIFQYMRIFTQPRVVTLCKIMVGVLIIYGLWTVIGSALMCMPVAFFWDTTLHGKCMNKLAFWFSNAALNITTDIMIFSIPMPLLKQLQLPRKQKIGLMFVFGFGAFVCVTSVIRLKALYEISVATDTALEGVNAAIWSGIEINVAIACASLPALKPLITRVLPKLLSNYSTKGDRSNMHPLSDNAGHPLSNLSKKNNHEVNDTIKVEQTVYQARELRTSQEGSEKSLVNWKSDCYSEEQRKKKQLPHEVV